jgi:hypothetical protein
MTQTIHIAQRYCGPPETGNGGYVCGLLAEHIEGPAMVRLQVPIPLDAGMEVRPAQGGGIELARGATVIATARRSEVALAVPKAPSSAQAEAAAREYRGFKSHPFPHCFVCGPQRKAGDGMRIFAGRVAGTSLVASPWVPDASLADGAGVIRREFLWAALDCPGAFSFEPAEGNAVLLGELAASISGSVSVGEPCVVIGWELTRDGRRHFTGTALFSESGELRGLARATWFEMPPPEKA